MQKINNTENQAAGAVAALNTQITAAPGSAAKVLAQNGIVVKPGEGLGASGAQIVDPAAAKKYLDGQLQKNPGDADALALRAAADSQLGKNGAACSDAQAALTIKPSLKVANDIAQLTCKGGMDSAPSFKGDLNPQERTLPPGGDPAGTGPFITGSVPVIDVAATANSSLSGSALQEALGFMEKHNLALALDAASRAVRQDPHNLDAWLLRMAALKAGRNWRQVIADADQALKYNPNNLRLLNEKAYAQNRVKDYKGALATAERAIALDPTNARAYVNKAYALGGLGDRQGMIAALKVAASLDPKFQAELAAVLAGTGDVDDLFGDGKAKPAASESGRKEALKRLLVVLGVVLLVGLSTLIARFKRSGASGVWTRTPLPVAASNPPAPAPMAVASLPGRLRGKYQIGPQIGAGGMGIVYEGKDIPLDRKVAIKRMLPQLAAQEKLRERFVSEARIVADLHHPNIVDIHDIVEENQDIYLVFEFVDGKTVSDLIAEKGRLPFAEATKLMRDVAQALDFAHGKNIIHRDLKPSNVMINEAGRVIVMDFGLARAAKDLLTSAALTNTIVGTPAYMAPEQEEGVVCKQSDVYSLAVCLYEMLAGKRPFDGAPGAMMVLKLGATFTPISKLVSGLPAGIDIFFTCALAADPKTRPATPKEFVAALETMTPAPAARA